MKIYFTTQAEEDIEYWKRINPKMNAKILALIEDIMANPYSGIGKPEALRFKQTGYWSRRINHEHRLVYKVHGDKLYIAQCRYHY